MYLCEVIIQIVLDVTDRSHRQSDSYCTCKWQENSQGPIWLA